MMEQELGRVLTDQALVAPLPEPVPVSALPGDDPSRVWERLYKGLLSMRPDGKFDDEHLAFDLILAGFIESREVNKPCRSCGRDLLDYRYNRITVSGRIFMDAAAQAMSAGTAETLQAAQGEARQRGPQDAPKQP